ncbi:hypothetical protein RchiOBHm_Chr4g0433741 [Rosa chinensis]|uniref:DUF4228 domain protein n=1 Tax=Rosa chinensis TaxID=74649 RepID=A0A2P6R1B1_ROSCH|nr:uncharacterized protein LOC112199640 [Rosa chinensis]PRQ40221.1 hypothetical protein RchiOBHm_Chr4g0433741 [Rosa chinensis]
MGNYISCTLATPLIKSTKAARVVFPTGEVRQFREPIKAAELMLESPNTFLANSRSLHIGRRFSALAADEELEFGNVYIMFPMRRLSSIVTAADMTIFFIAANSAAKRISGGKVRILPEAQAVQNDEEEEKSQSGDGEGQGPARLSLDGVEGLQVAEFQYRLAACRSRKPMLETIKEELIFSR